MHTLTANWSELAGLIGPTPPKREFRDRYDLRSYARTILLVRRLMDDPRLVARGADYLERFVRPDPRQRRIYDLWVQALHWPVEDLAARLLADDAQGEVLRGTAPVFVVIPPDEVRGLASRAA